MAKVIQNNYVYGSPACDSPVRILSCSDLHWPGKGVKSKASDRLVEFLSDPIKNKDVEILLVPGDFINSPDLLETREDRKAFLEYIKRLTGGRLLIGSIGNHERMVLRNGVWHAEESTALQDTLTSLDNVKILDGLESFSLADSNLVTKGFSTANINIVGASLPGSYYIDEHEEAKAYLEHLIQMFEGKNPFLEGMTNIMLLHEVRNLILLLKSGIVPRDIVSKLEGVLINGGHNHGGGVPNIFQPLNPFNCGLMAPSGKKLPTDVIGHSSHLGINFIQNGYAADFKPDSQLINACYTKFDRGAVTCIRVEPGLKPGLRKVRRLSN